MGGRSQGEIEDRSPGHGLRDTGTGVLAHLPVCQWDAIRGECLVSRRYRKLGDAGLVSLRS